MKGTQTTRQSSLQLYWYEIKPNDEKAAALGQFLGAIHRLLGIDEELTDAMRQRDIRKRLHRVTRIIESYLYRAYELRERMVNFLAVASGDMTAAKATKHPRKRAKALRKIQGLSNEAGVQFDRLMRLLDDDMLLRNMHTHEQFLILGHFAHNGPYDPEDVLMDLENRPKEYQAMCNLLRKETRKLADEYRDRIRSVRIAACAFAEIAGTIRLHKK